MNKLFGKKKPPPGPAPTLSEAAGRIDERVQKLDQTIMQLETELKKFKEQLSKAKGPTAQRLKQRAMEVLKRKRMYEQQRDQLAGQQFNIEQTSFAIDSVKDTATTVAALKEAKGALGAQIKMLNIDEVEDITDDLADALEDINEINDALGRAYNTPDDLEDADLDAELAMLEDDLINDEAEDVHAGAVHSVPEYLQPAALTLSSAPSHTVHVQEEGVDEYGLPVARTT